MPGCCLCYHIPWDYQQIIPGPENRELPPVAECPPPWHHVWLPCGHGQQAGKYGPHLPPDTSETQLRNGNHHVSRWTGRFQRNTRSDSKRKEFHHVNRSSPPVPIKGLGIKNQSTLTFHLSLTCTRLVLALFGIQLIGLATPCRQHIRKISTKLSQCPSQVPILGSHAFLSWS